MQLRSRLVFIALLLIAPSTVAARDYLRVDQLGYAPDDPKVARLLAYANREGEPFRVVRAADGATVLSGTIGPSTGSWGFFGFTLPCDFSSLRATGWYRVVAGGTRSAPFTIEAPAYAATAEALLGFFAVQRCGATHPAGHRPCHLSDGASERIDLTGGWHDAGDYTKFLTSTAGATYLLLLAEEIRPGLAGDRDGNGRSDLLDEARIGADWCLRLRFARGRYVRQVQDTRDHRVGWRLPENDPLTRDRPAFDGVGRNHLGRLAATLARAARAFQTLEPAWAESCRVAAEDAYAAAALAPPIGESESYTDVTWLDKMALGAAELYLTTGRRAYLADARRLCDEAGPGGWCGWSTVNGLAHALLAPEHAPSLVNLEKDLLAFRRQSEAHPWGMAGKETWGTTMVVAGVAVEALLYERLTGRADFVPLALTQRDFLFGANPWGVSFVGGLGAVFPSDFHHQVACLTGGGALPGAMAEGPAPPAVFDAQKIELASPDEYAEFQSERGVYHDDRHDYVTNEPTLTANATALLLMALLDARATGVAAPVTANATLP
jgi:endoglucanase